MEATTRDFLLLVHGFLQSKNLHKTAKTLEEESSIFLNLERLSSMIEARSWTEIESYLESFVDPQQTPYSRRAFFIIKREKFLHLASHDKEKALGVLLNELKEFSQDFKEVYNDLFLMLNREIIVHQPPPRDSTSRSIFLELKQALEDIPALEGKLTFPEVDPSDVRAAINESLNINVETVNYLQELESPLYILSENGRFWISQIPMPASLPRDLTPCLGLSLGPPAE